MTANDEILVGENSMINEAGISAPKLFIFVVEEHHM
jgi:hypothetical protein